MVNESGRVSIKGQSAGKLLAHNVLVDENNKIIAKNLRGDELKQKIAELLK